MKLLLFWYNSLLIYLYNLNLYLPILWSKFKCIWEKIQKYLRKPSFVPINIFKEMRYIFVNYQLRLNIFLFWKIAKHFECSINGFQKIKIFIVQVKFHLLSLCKVHHVIYKVDDHYGAVLSTFKVTDWSL